MRELITSYLLITFLNHDGHRDTVTVRVRSWLSVPNTHSSLVLRLCCFFLHSATRALQWLLLNPIELNNVTYRLGFKLKNQVCVLR